MTNNNGFGSRATDYHLSLDQGIATLAASHQDTQFTYRFENFFHPFVGKLLKQLQVASLDGFFDPTFQATLVRNFFDYYYTRHPSATVAFDTLPVKDLDVSDGGPYACYNWELFYHVPVMIAVTLTKNQRFVEARDWFHYVFDPTTTDTTTPAPERYWKFLRFRQESGPPKNIADLVALLSDPAPTADEQDDINAVLAGLDAIRNSPFMPHAVARTRIVSYQNYVFMKYLDNLIAWGDSLFVQDTLETVNEATLCYVLANDLLGPRPQQIPESGTIKPMTYNDLRAQKLDPLGNALVDLESQFPFNLSQPPAPGDSQSGALFGIGRTLYFCVPQNDQLLAYWDTVADRLYKIRNCLNIQGVFTPLPLFDPPLDPAMLVKAAAAGIDIGSIASGSNQPIGPIRSQLLIQKSLELASEVRAFGASLLAALEKGDAETLSVLRQTQEVALQKIQADARFIQWKHAERTSDALLASRAISYERYAYYQRLLGATLDSSVAPATLSLKRTTITADNFDSVYADLVSAYDLAVPDQPFPRLALATTSSPAATSGAQGTGAMYLSQTEDAELNTHLPNVKTYQGIAYGLKHALPMLAEIPEFPIDLHYWGLGGTIMIGGTEITRAASLGADILEFMAQREQQDANAAGITATFERRADEWIQQNNLAARELIQYGKQIIASLVAEQAAKRDYDAATTQAANSQDVLAKLQSKFTNADLYGWMQGELSQLYYQYYQLAFDTARRAEQTMKRELMRPELDATDFVQFNYWDGSHKGLLAGEALHYDVKRMEVAYYENNQRELEITRHVSLRQLDPIALLTLRATGTCNVNIPEWLFDKDCPGLYLRRLKTVALSIPAVVGPYASVNCKLTLLNSSVRTSSLLANNVYGRNTTDDDDRFVDYVGAQSIVTSAGTSDSGMFETQLRDERFLPFEGMGAISSWRLDLPTDLKPFDYTTISDVLLHVRYTARDGGSLLGGAATKELKTMLAATSELALLFALRYDFPTEWAAFQNTGTAFNVSLRKDYFPYLVQGDNKLAVTALELYGTSTTKRVIDIPPTMAADLNGATGAASLSIPADNTLLTTSATQVLLVVRYTI